MPVQSIGLTGTIFPDILGLAILTCSLEGKNYKKRKISIVLGKTDLAQPNLTTFERRVVTLNTELDTIWMSPVFS